MNGRDSELMAISGLSQLMDSLAEGTIGWQKRRMRRFTVLGRF